MTQRRPERPASSRSRRRAGRPAAKRARPAAHRHETPPMLRDALARCTNDIVFAYGTGWDCTFWNPVIERITGVAEPAALGSDVRALLAAFVPSAIEAHLARALAGEESFLAGIEMTVPPGEPHTFEGRFSPLRDARGRVAGGFAALRNVTDRSAAEDVAARSQAVFRAIFHRAIDAITLFDDESHILDANPSACAIFGAPREMVVGVPLRAFSSPDLDFDGAFHRLRSEGSLTVDWRVLRPDGTYRDIEVVAVADVLPGVHLTIARDVTERRRTEAERAALLEAAESAMSQQRALADRLVGLQEEERRRLGRELHDEFGQILTGLRFLLDTALRDAGDGWRASVEECAGMTADLARRIREISLDLTTAMLDDLGLVPVLRRNAAEFAARTGIVASFHHSEVACRFTSEVELAAYRIAQEAMTNAARHSGTKSVTVRLWRAGGSLFVQVQDDGCGFDVDASQGGRSSLGLVNMRGRAARLGGELIIESAPGAGTSVTAEIPCAAIGGGAA